MQRCLVVIFTTSELASSNDEGDAYYFREIEGIREGGGDGGFDVGGAVACEVEGVALCGGSDGECHSTDLC